jgi:hypothetical protein
MYGCVSKYVTQHQDTYPTPPPLVPHLETEPVTHWNLRRHFTDYLALFNQQASKTVLILKKEPMTPISTPSNWGG